MRTAVLTLLTLLLATPTLAAPKPNIILFLSDDHGIDFTGCYGNPAVHTPNIDALAKQGLRFDRAFAASPTCSPARAALFTGLYPQRNGTMGNHTNCRPDVKSIAAYLQPLGYRVVAADKTDVRPNSVFTWELLPAVLPKNPNFKRIYRGEGLDTAKVDAFLAAHAKEHPDQPLCLLIGDNAPHVLWEKNRDFDPAKLPLPPIMLDTPKTRTALANYYQDIATMDHHLGDVLDSVKRHGLEPNTCFIYSTDQGPEWPHAKWTCYDTGLHIPFIVRWPGVTKPATTTDALINAVDLLPTLIQLAGGSQPQSLDGRSFHDVLTGAATTADPYVFASHTGDGDMNLSPQRSVRDARYKLILNLHPERKWTTHFTKVDGIPDSHHDVYATWEQLAQSDPAAATLLKKLEWHPTLEFYDTQSDPFELTNLIDSPDHAPKIAELRQQLHHWLESMHDDEALKAMK